MYLGYWTLNKYYYDLILYLYMKHTHVYILIFFTNVNTRDLYANGWADLGGGVGNFRL